MFQPIVNIIPVFIEEWQLFRPMGELISIARTAIPAAMRSAPLPRSSRALTGTAPLLLVRQHRAAPSQRRTTKPSSMPVD